MRIENNRPSSQPPDRHGAGMRLQSPGRRGLRAVLAATLALGLGTALADDDDRDAGNAGKLRRFIASQVGGIDKLTVPANDSDLPQPRLANGQPDPFFQTTEAKRYLGKQLFHDPARMVRIRPQFGGVPATAGSASCGSCHLGETASKAGTLLNFAVGGEGRHYTDAQGNFIARRRANTELLPQRRSTPLFPGDALVDHLPTLTDIWLSGGKIIVGTPALGFHLPAGAELQQTGRLDALDSVGRNAPGVIGSAFNNRLLLFGLAGEPHATPGGLNPFNHPAQENVALLLLDAHRLLQDQASFLRTVPVYRKLFRDAFPAEAAKAPNCVPEKVPGPGDCDALIGDLLNVGNVGTVERATATFLRTTVTRDTPWDRFLAGDNGALTKSQRRGAKLFFTAADKGGAGCYGCHSGPMLNKQVDDPDVAGVGEYVEQNFYNIGLGDHPVQALNRAARNDPNFRDEGRQEVTQRLDKGDAFKFRVLTLRQLKDARLFFHDGSFTKVRDVVQYFNAGVPLDPVSGAANTLSRRFTHPRGDAAPRGLGLNDDQVDDIADFIENALYDPAFAKFDPKKPRTFFELSPIDTTYSKYRLDLAALGAVDGRPASGMPPNNDDPLSRRDMGLEFLDVTSKLHVRRIDAERERDGRSRDVYRITNNSTSIVDTHLLLIARGLPADRLRNASGVTSSGDPYRRVFLRDGVLLPGQSIVRSLEVKRDGRDKRPSYTLTLLSGQGNP
jgi:cytochrome c peroxidase